MISETKVSASALKAIKKQLKHLAIWSNRFTVEGADALRVPLIDALSAGAAFSTSLSSASNGVDNTGPLVTLTRYHKTIEITGAQKDASIANKLSDYVEKVTEAVLLAANDAVNALLTTGNFSAVLDTAVEDFDSTDVKALRAVAGNREWDQKNLVLVPDLYNQVIPADRNALPLYEFTAVEGKHLPDGVLGYIANPIGIAIATGMSAWVGTSDKQFTVTDADTGLTVRITFWSDTNLQKEYLTADIRFGAAVGVGGATGGVGLITEATEAT